MKREYEFNPYISQENDIIYCSDVASLALRIKSNPVKLNNREKVDFVKWKDLHFYETVTRKFYSWKKQ